MEKSLADQIEKNMAFLYYCAIKYYPDRNDADDVVQDSIIKMTKSYNKEKFTRGWMGLVVASVALDKKEKESRRTILELNDYNTLYSNELEEAFDSIDFKNYKESLIKIASIAIERLEDDVQKQVLRKAIRGIKLKDIELENVTRWKIKDSYRKGIKNLRGIAKKALEMY